MFALLLALSAVLLYASLHEVAEWRVRVSEKRANCHHDYRSMDGNYGQHTLRCHRCGHQTFKPKDPND